jgi:hypothetical protein
MRRVLRFLTAAAAVGLVAVPATARAEGFFSPWAGVNFDSQPVEQSGAYGITAGAMGAGVIGGEFDFGYSPDIFGEPVDNHGITLMGNLVIGIPIGGTSGVGVRPYVTGGVGLIRTSIDDVFGDKVTENHFGINVGGGIMGFFSDHFGLRGDLRYFRNLQEDDDPDPFDIVDLGGLDFWRASVGIVIR